MKQQFSKEAKTVQLTEAQICKMSKKLFSVNVVKTFFFSQAK
jgi:hypothetical protein